MYNCCNQNTISGSVNLNVTPGTGQNSCTVKVNIPICQYKRLIIKGEVLNSSTGLSIPYASLQLFEKSSCSCEYKRIACTTSNCRGMYEFNLFLNRASGCKKYKIIATIPYQTLIETTTYVQDGCNQSTNSCCYNQNHSCSYDCANNQCGSCEYTIEYPYNDSTPFNQNTEYNPQNNNKCCNNIQELQDGYPNQSYGYIQNEPFQNGQCFKSNFWND